MEAEGKGEVGEREREERGRQLLVWCSWTLGLFDKKQNTRHISWKVSSCPEATDPNFYIETSACSLLSWSDCSAGKCYSAKNFSSAGTHQNLHTAFIVSGKVNFTPCYVTVFFLILIHDCIWPSRWTPALLEGRNVLDKGEDFQNWWGLNFLMWPGSLACKLNLLKQSWFLGVRYSICNPF